MAVVTTNLGPVTAYGDAVRGGYTGTKEQWEALMADYGTIGTQAQADAQTASTAAQTATTKASEASASATQAQQAAASVSTPDTTLTQSGKAADAKATGDAVAELKEDLSDMTTATADDVGKALKAKTVTDGKVTEWEFGSTGSGSGLTNSQKLAILNCFAHVAWTDAQGQTYYDELEEVLFPPAELTSISAVYVNSNPVYTDTDIDTLKQYITVTAHYSDGTSSVVNAYTLSGTLTVGTSTLTVAYSEMTTTISVTVSVTPKSDMNGWTDGVMYTDIEVVEDKYFDDGTIKSYGGWDRTGYIPCHGASTIVFEAADIANGLNQRYNGFFDENKSYIQSMGNVSMSGATITVPSNAHYFGFSGEDTKVAAFISAGFTPHA